MMIFVLTDHWPLSLGLSVATLLYLLVLWLLKTISADEIRSLPHVFLAALQKHETEQKP